MSITLLNKYKNRIDEPSYQSSSFARRHGVEIDTPTRLKQNFRTFHLDAAYQLKFYRAKNAKRSGGDPKIGGRGRVIYEDTNIFSGIFQMFRQKSKVLDAPPAPLHKTYKTITIKLENYMSDEPNNQVVAPNLISKGEAGVTRAMENLKVPTFNHEIAVYIVDAIANGNAITKVLENYGLTQFQFFSWRKQQPQFDQLIKIAKKARAEGITEKLVEHLVNLMNKPAFTADDKSLMAAFKIAERITSMHDKEQNLKIAGTNISINNTINKTPHTDIKIKDIYAGKESQKSLDDLRSKDNDYNADFEDVGGQ